MSSFDYAWLYTRLGKVCSCSKWVNIVSGFVGRLASSGFLDSGSQKREVCRTTGKFDFSQGFSPSEVAPEDDGEMYFFHSRFLAQSFIFVK